MVTTTLTAIRRHHPCRTGWAKLLAHLGKVVADDEPLALCTILESNGIVDAIWSLRTVTGADKEIRLFAVACAREVQHLMATPESISALDVAERYANGTANSDELHAAAAAATDAVYAGCAGYAAAAAGYAAAADAARAARAAAAAAAVYAAYEKQSEIFKSFFGE